MQITREKKQVVLLYGATLGSVFFGVFSSIINTRFLDPTNYGDVRYVQNIISFIASLLLFGFFLSGSRLLAISKDEKNSREIRGIMIVILAVASGILCLSTTITAFIHYSNRILFSLFLISLPVCLNPLLVNYVNTTAQGDNHIGRLAIARLSPLILYVGIAYLVYSKFGATSVRMILLQWGIATIILCGVIISQKPSFLNLKSKFELLKKENKQYGFHLYIGSLIMVSTNYLAGISLGIFNENNSEVGFYTLALTVTQPLAMLPQIIGTTYFKKFATLPSIPKNVFKATIALTLSSCICFIVLIKPIVVFLYTERYSVVGLYASILAVGFCFHGVGDMMNRYLGSHGLGKCIRNASICNGIIKVLGYTFFVMLWNTKGALVTTLICSIVYCMMMLYYYVKFVRGQSQKST